MTVEVVEIIKSEEQKFKKDEVSKQNLRDTIKWTNIHIMGVPKVKERER